jgi:hypothetical protein
MFDIVHGLNEVAYTFSIQVTPGLIPVSASNN